MPCSAARARFVPSNRNGLVTTPTVRAPSSRAACATMGAAPVPVPPPMPAVTKTMSASPMASLIAPILSCAASRPTLGSAPAPSPLVSFSPIWSLISALERSRACASVLAQMKETPFRPAMIMFCTALPPPPPTPMTFIFAGGVSASNCISIIAPPQREQRADRPDVRKFRKTTFSCATGSN